MKQNHDGIKLSLIIFVMVHIYSISITGSAGVTAGRIATKYIPTIISSTVNQVDSHKTISTPQYNLPQYKINIPTAGFINSYSGQEKVINIVPKLFQEELPAPSHDEYHIYTDLLTDENIELFKNKFNEESDAFTSKLSDFWTLIKDKYDEISDNSDVKPNPTTHNHNTSTTLPVILSRDEAISEIKSVTEKIFDPNDFRPLSAYITDMKKFTKSLNPNEDKVIIDAIDFLQKNQHRTNIWTDSLFWAQAAQEQGLTAIPKSSVLNDISNKDKIKTLTSKANLKG